MKTFGRLLLALLLLGAAPSAQAQSWPPKTVHIYVPFGAGSTPDTVARLIADEFGKKYPGNAFVVENRPGAINTLLFSKLPYDPKKDIAAITQLITQPSALAVAPSLGVDNVAALVKLLKDNPGKYNFASIGNGSLSHLAMEALALASGTKIVHVP